MESKLALQRRSFGDFPEHQEAFFESRGGLRSTVAQAGHGLRPESKLVVTSQSLISQEMPLRYVDLA
jgi:hypothetical protein